ncbi:MAG: DUF3096 domain-containing protein [Candidatus Nanoarchaeia archaeon]
MEIIKNTNKSGLVIFFILNILVGILILSFPDLLGIIFGSYLVVIGVAGLINSIT